MKRIISKIIMLLILLMITCSNFAFAIDKDSIKCLDEDGNACKIETKLIKPGYNSSTAETTITVLKSNNIYVNEVLTLSLTSTRGLWDGELNVVQTAYNDSEMNVKFNTEEIDYEYDGYNSVNIKKLEIEILKEGTYTYSFKIKDSQLTETINITIEGVTKNPAVLEAEEENKKATKENEELETYYKKNISEITNFSEKLKYLRSIMYNDKCNNNTNLWNKFVSETTPEQRKSWYTDITYNSRNSDSEYQTIINALKTQIDVDNKNASETDLKNKIDEARKCSTKST